MSPFETYLPNHSPPSRRRGIRAALSFALIAIGVFTSPFIYAAEEESPRDVSADDVWLISTRWSHHYDAPELRTWRNSEGRWVAATPEEFLATDDPTVPTVIWVHGDRVDHWESAGNGMTVYRRLRAHSGGRPFRFVIWSWPSSDIHGVGPLRETRIKASRSDNEAASLAWFIDRIEPSTPVSLIGYSFGARIATGALHLLGGGRLVERQMTERLLPDRHPLRAVLLAAALDNYSLAQGQRNGLALSQVDQLLNLYNPCDEVLKWYSLLCSLHGPEAAGYTGLVGYLGEHRSKVRQVDVSGYIGDSHDWQDYFYYRGIVARIAGVALFPDRPAGLGDVEIVEPTTHRVRMEMPRVKLER